MAKRTVLKAELERQRDEIARQRNEIIESIQYAGMIQKSLLPRTKVLEPYFPEHFLFYLPRNIVSGDFYWFVPRGERLYFAVADCTGHGVPGALMSILGLSFLNEIITSRDHLPANRILNLLREMVMKALHQTGDTTEAADGMDIALCIFDRSNRVLQYAGANNPLYIIREEVAIEYKPDRMPIGISGMEEQPFSNRYVELRPGDWLYLFTDGYVDQFGGPRGKKYKYDPFKALLIKMAREPASRQKERIEQEYLSWKGSYPQVDDILVMGLKVP